jgi:hypothetical protein
MVKLIMWLFIDLNPGDVDDVAARGEPMGNVAERVHLQRDPADPPVSCA